MAVTVRQRKPSIETPCTSQLGSEQTQELNAKRLAAKVAAHADAVKKGKPNGPEGTPFHIKKGEQK